MRQQQRAPVEGLCRYVNVPRGRVHLTREQLDAARTTLDDQLQLRAQMRAASPSMHQMGDVMAAKLTELGYDVSAWSTVQ